MHFVTGGAFNGKKKWVISFYELNAAEDFLLLPAFDQSIATLMDVNQYRKLTIIEGFEYAVLRLLEAPDGHSCWDKWLETWQKWENQNERKLVVIGSDIGKGVVPADSFDRKWRDETGRFYQKIVEHSDRVDVIWYGIATTIKNANGQD